MNNIDFDQASLAWRENKKKKPNGMFVYKCCYIRSLGKRCTRTIEKCISQSAYQMQHAWSYEINNYNKSEYFCKRHKNRSTYQLKWQN